MNTRLVNSAAGVILAALEQNRTAAGIAMALESAGLLMSPESAADIASVSSDAVALLEQAVVELKREHGLSAGLRQEVDRLFLVWGSARMRARRKNEALKKLRARVSELEAERHVTNEALSDAAEALRVSRDRDAVVAEFVADRASYITAINNCHPDNDHDYDRWQGHAESRRQLAQELGLPVAWPPEYGQDVSAEAARSADRLTALLAPSPALREDGAR